MATSSQPIKEAPGPWKCRVQWYSIVWYCKTSKSIPSIAYSSLEAQSSFASGIESGQPVGGLHNIQIVRYLESPVGPYDELLIIPGAFAYTVEECGKRKEKVNSRITRIYVSSRDSCYNGRNNWNIPKHLARFEWKNFPNGATQLKVFPHDTTSDPAEAEPSDVPFFQTTFKTVPYAPCFPMATSLCKYLGIDVNLVGPPLPKGGAEELVGTTKWAKAFPQLSSRKTHVGWFDMKQTDGDGKQLGEFENFWRGLGRWILGVRMDDADFVMGAAEHWEAPRSTQ